MIVDIASESPGDEAILRVIVAALVGSETTCSFSPRNRQGGVQGLLKAIPSFVCASYRKQARGLVLVVDSNGTSVNPATRLDELNQRVNKALSLLPPRTPPFSIAVGLAVPSIEAWLQFGSDLQASEASWLREPNPGAAARERIRRMKCAIYGTDSPTVDRMKSEGVARARHIAHDLPALEAAFPVGFKPLV